MSPHYFYPINRGLFPNWPPSSHSLIRLNVAEHGLLSYFDRGVHVLWLQSLPFISGLLCCFTNIASISLTRQFILMFEWCKVLAMPVHRPHAPYVDVPKWERKMVIISSLAFVYETDNRIAKIRFLFLLVVDRYIWYSKNQ